jgi:hypothetical protein
MASGPEAGETWTIRDIIKNKFNKLPSERDVLVTFVTDSEVSFRLTRFPDRDLEMAVPKHLWGENFRYKYVPKYARTLPAVHAFTKYT